MRELKVIAKIHSEFKEKFGIPRQSGMVDLPAKMVFEPEFRDANAVRGLDGFSHIWLLWEFSEAKLKRVLGNLPFVRRGWVEISGWVCLPPVRRSDLIQLDCLR